MHIQTSDQERIKMGFGDYSCNWGLHICGLYETEQERDEILFGYLHQGCLDGNYQLYAYAERSEQDFRSRYAAEHPNCAKGLNDPNCFAISPARQLYYPHGTFSARDMDSSLNDFYSHAQEHGKRYVRGAAEMVWALEAVPGAEELMIYESRLNYFVQGKYWASFCLYNVNKFSGAQIMKVLQTHPLVTTGKTIMRNTYYIDPDRWLAENAPQYLGQN